MTNVVNALMNAKKPVIFVGNGVRQSGSIDLLKQILSQIQVPVLTTWRAADLFLESDPLYVGRPGMIGQRGANFILQSCDLLICLGTRLDLAQIAFNYNGFAPNAKKIVVDIDISELNKITTNITPIQGSVGIFLRQLQNDLKSVTKGVWTLRAKCPSWIKWRVHCKALHEKYQSRLVEEAAIQGSKDALSLYRFLKTLNPYLKDKIVVLGSSGTIAEVFFQVVEILPGMRIINTPGLGSMGFAIAAAIGAHYATGREIICIDGDGSFAMNIQELAVVDGLQLPIQFYVINNGGYVSIRNTQDNLCEKRHLGSEIGGGLYLPNLCSMASNYDNIEYSCIYNYYYFKPPNNSLPALCEVGVDTRHQTVCRTKTRRMSDGALQASSLENLWPFLSKDEIKQAMTF